MFVVGASISVPSFTVITRKAYGAIRVFVCVFVLVLLLVLLLRFVLVSYCLRIVIVLVFVLLFSCLCLEKGGEEGEAYWIDEGVDIFSSLLSPLLIPSHLISSHLISSHLILSKLPACYGGYFWNMVHTKPALHSIPSGLGAQAMSGGTLMGRESFCISWPVLF